MDVYIDLSSFLNDMSGPVPPNIFSSYLKPSFGGTQDFQVVSQFASA